MEYFVIQMDKKKKVFQASENSFEAGQSVRRPSRIFQTKCWGPNWSYLKPGDEGRNAAFTPVELKPIWSHIRAPES